MAVAEQTPYKEYTANGITKIFPLGFDVLEQDHLIVLMDDIEPTVGSWSLDALNDAIVFILPPIVGSNIKVRRDTPFERSNDYKNYNSSLKPEAINSDLDNIWLKLQEMGVLNWMVDNNIKDLGDYVDGLNDETKAQFLAEIQKQGITLNQLEQFTNNIYQNLANVAVNKGWFAEFIADGDENQKQINDKNIQEVANVSSLRDLIPRKNGQIAKTAGHTVERLGGAIFRYEILSSKPDNDGAWIASNVSPGTWVLSSEVNYIEHFGVVPDNNDQSVKMQKAIDYYIDNNIKSFGFERQNTYCIASPVRFKQRLKDGNNYADPRNTITWNFNCAVLKALTDNQNCVVISRDCVQITDFSATSQKTGVVGIYNGLDIENNDSNLRRSSMRMVLMNPKFDHIDVAMKFEPGETKFGGQWGAFYHSVINPTATFVQIMYEFRQSKGAGDSSNTRNTFINSKHIGGACTVYGEALESSVFMGVESELINRADSRLPDGEAVALYLPFGTPSDYQANKQNKFYGFNVESCTNYVNINAPETHISGYFQAATNPQVKAWKYNNTYENIDQVEGGLRLRQYNSTPRFGMVQINDNDEPSSLYIEGSGKLGDWKFVADGRVEIPQLSIGVTRAINSFIGFADRDGNRNLAVTFNDDIDFAFLSGTSGIVGFTGILSPVFDSFSNIGSGSRRVKNIYLANSPIVSSDEKYKKDIRSLSIVEQNIAQQLKKSIKAYRLKDSEDDKWRMGVIAQDVVKVFTENGLDASDYNLIHYEDEYYSIRYEELLVFIMSSI